MKIKSLLTMSALFITASIFAQKQFDPKYEKITPRISYAPGIKVIRGETQVIIPMQESHCPAGLIFKYNNGHLQVRDMRSEDGGMTWQKVDQALNASAYQFPEPDGEVLQHSFLTIKTSNKGIFRSGFLHSKDNGLSWKKDSATIILPEEFSNWSGVTDRKIVMIEDGSLLMSMYGRSPDKVGYWVFLVRSIDHGRTWNYYSTVTFNLVKGLFDEGYCEPCLLVLPGSKILCLMRTSGSYSASLGSSGPNLMKPTPLYMSISNDNGKEWSDSEPVAPLGVWPDAVLMENGIIAVGYGRSGNWLMFSNNEVQTWGPVIPFYNDIYPPDCGNYFSLEEVSPGILLVVYARTDVNDNSRSEIVGTYFKVIKEEQKK